MNIWIIPYDNILKCSRYGFGYWTGKKCDLLCIKICKTNIEAERNLSPITTNIFTAFIAFLFKRLKERI